MSYLNQPALYDLIEAAYVLFAPYSGRNLKRLQSVLRE
jgi:hypothetical protein